MASIIKDPNGRKRLAWTDGSGDRVQIYLGKATMHDAREWKTRGENILSANMSGHAIDNTTAEWCHNLPNSAHDKLVEKGLIPPRTASRQDSAATLGNFLTTYLNRNQNVKDSTKDVWSRAIANLIDHFGVDRDLQTINPGRQSTQATRTTSRRHYLTKD